MRILLDCSRISTGGSIQVALAILHNAVATPQHEWHVVMSAELSAEFPRRFDSAFKSIARLEQWTALERKILSPVYMKKRERAIRPDIVFSIFGPVYWRPKARHLVGFALPHLIYPHTDVGQARKLWTRVGMHAAIHLRVNSFRQADCLIVETDTVRDRLESVLGIPRSRVFVVRNTYSQLFEASLQRAPAKEAGGPFSILVPSAAYPHKNLQLIPHVIRELESSGDKTFEFVLTLPERSSEWRALEKMAEPLKVLNRLRTVGHIRHPELAAHYRRADAVFLPTILECSTAVYPESFLAGVPVVTSKLDFAKELCGHAALYFDPHSAKEAARALAKLMSDRNLRKSLIENGRKQIRKVYIGPREKWEAQLECMEQIAG